MIKQNSRLQRWNQYRLNLRRLFSYILISALNYQHRLVLMVFILFSIHSVQAATNQLKIKSSTSKLEQTHVKKNGKLSKIKKNSNKQVSINKSSDKKNEQKKLEKNLSFNDRMVNGKHQVPGEGLVTVENEKPVFNLLSIRKDFRDRRAKEGQRE